MRVIRPSSVLLPALFVMLSCSDPSGPRTPTNITVVSGGGQSGVVGSALPQAVVVEVKDVDGRAVRGADVTWTVAAGDGSVSAPSTATDGNGRAQVSWTLGTTAGENRLRAAVTGVGPVTITATAEPAAPAAMSIVSGSGQTGLELGPLAEPLVARVVDAHGNGVPGVAVSFTAGSGVVTPAIATTDAGGMAEAVWTLGQAADEHTLDAGSAALPDVTLTFTATALAPDAIAVLENHVRQDIVSAAQGTRRYYRITVPDGVTHLTVLTLGTNEAGDADLYMRRGVLPDTAGTNACESLSPSATESCRVETPASGEWYVLLHAYSALSNVTIESTYVVGGMMAINIDGLPQGLAGSISVTGPAYYDRAVTATSTLTGLTPGTYTITASQVADGTTVYAPLVEVQQMEATEGGTVGVPVSYAATTGGLNIDIAGAYITQGVQRRDGSIPLIAGRDGLLRVFARANVFNTATPAVRARFYQSGALIDTRMISAPSTAVPIAHSEGDLASTWNVYLPGSLIQPGVTMLVDVDPLSAVAEADETDNSFPESGTAANLNVRAVPVLRATLVPVVQRGSTTPADVNAANADTYLTLADALYPLPDIDVEVRAPYTFDGILPASYDSVWQRLLLEINVLRLNEARDRHFYGVIRPSYTSGGTGLGYIGQPAAIGVEWSNHRAETVAHEWGHNFGRLHVDCGNPASVDPFYPYEGGRIGHHGYDKRTNELHPLDSHHDLMSYCRPTWSSDYTYEAVMERRGSAAGPAAAVALSNVRSGADGAAAEPTLLVWGRISPEGAVLEPAFEIVARPALPEKTGRYRLTGTDENGATVLDVSFDGYEIDHMPGVRLFAYTIPLSSMGGRIPSEMRLRGAGVDEVRNRSVQPAVPDDVRAERDGQAVRLRWNALRNPVVMVRDGRTGEILSFARDGDARIMTAADEMEVTMSDGVRSTMRRIRVVR